MFGYSQENVAKDIGISQQMYGFIENGERQKDISLDMLQRLSKALHTPLEDMIRLESDYKNSLPQ